MSAKQQNDKVAQWILKNAPERITGGGAGDVAVCILEEWKKEKDRPADVCPKCGERASKSAGVGLYGCEGGHQWRGPDTRCTLCSWLGFYEDYGNHMDAEHDGNIALPPGDYWVMVTSHNGVARFTMSPGIVTTRHLEAILAAAVYGLAAKSLPRSTSDSEENA